MYLWLRVSFVKLEFQAQFSVTKSGTLREGYNINEMATLQLQSSRAVVRSMQSITRSTQASSASTHTTSQNMWKLARLVEQLRVSVEAFKVRQSRNSPFPITPPPVGQLASPGEQPFLKSARLQKMDLTK
jgi:hypothetical protein